MMHQDELEILLKSKGIGPKGSKSLSEDQIKRLWPLMKNDKVSMTTKVTMLVALRTLERTPEEDIWLKEAIDKPEEFPSPLRFLLSGELNNDSDLQRFILKVSNRNDLTASDAAQAMNLLLDIGQPAYLKAAFLEAERLKRETFEENLSFFKTMYSRVNRFETDLPVLIEIGDNYDGHIRTRHWTPFVASLISALGFPVLLTGIDKVAPKQGLTTHQLLKASGKDPLRSHGQVIKALKDPEVGWGYLDQEVFFPELHDMKTVRKEMVKRPYLATFEKLMSPIKAPDGNYIITGYTHAHYRTEVIELLKEGSTCSKALLVKGIEGSARPWLSVKNGCMFFNGKEIEELSVSPESYGLASLSETQNKEFTVEDSLSTGIAFLKGEKSDAEQPCIYQAALILETFGLMSGKDALNRIKEVIDSGKAFQHWERY